MPPSALPEAWLNGVPFDIRQPIFRADSPAFMRGDALWEVLRVEGGHTIGWDLHFRRLTQGVRDARLSDVDLTEPLLDAIGPAREAAKRYACGKLYFAVLPNGAGFDYLATVEAYMPLEDGVYRQGYRGLISDLPHPMLGAYGKSTSYQWSRIAQRRAEEQGADMAILLHDDEVVEATTAAIVYRRGETWYTVRDHNGALPSTTVKLLEAGGLAFDRRHTRVEDLLAADSVCLVSALRLAIGLRSLGERTYDSPDTDASMLRRRVLRQLDR